MSPPFDYAPMTKVAHLLISSRRLSKRSDRAHRCPFFHHAALLASWTVRVRIKPSTWPGRALLPCFLCGELEHVRFRDWGPIGTHDWPSCEEVAPRGHQCAALGQELRPVVRPAYCVLLAVRERRLDCIGLRDAELVGPGRKRTAKAVHREGARSEPAQRHQQRHIAHRRADGERRK